MKKLKRKRRIRRRRAKRKRRKRKTTLKKAMLTLLTPTAKAGKLQAKVVMILTLVWVTS